MKNVLSNNSLIQMDLISSYSKNILDHSEFSSIEEFEEYFMESFLGALSYCEEHEVLPDWVFDKVSYRRNSRIFIGLHLCKSLLIRTDGFISESHIQSRLLDLVKDGNNFSSLIFALGSKSHGPIRGITLLRAFLTLSNYFKEYGEGDDLFLFETGFLRLLGLPFDNFLSHLVDNTSSTSEYYEFN